MATRRALNDVTGAYAIGVLWKGDPGRIVGAKCESPLVVGLGEGDFFFASDIPAILNHTRNVLFLNDGEMVVLTRDGVQITTLAGRAGAAAGRESALEPHPGGEGRLQALHAEGDLRAAPRRPGHHPRPVLRGSGQIFFEGMEHWTRSCRRSQKVVLHRLRHGLARGPGRQVPDRGAVPGPGGGGLQLRVPLPRPGGEDRTRWSMAVSQSGETLDTLAGIKEAQARGLPDLRHLQRGGQLASPARWTASSTPTPGPEIGVAATKTFTAQLVALYLFALYFGRKRGTLDAERMRGAAGRPGPPAPADRGSPATWTRSWSDWRSAVPHQDATSSTWGAASTIPIALEGALKLKEISYIHAEGYPAGEMKHGPIALITEEMPVVILAPQDKVYEKILGNIEEVKARDGIVIAVCSEGDTELPGKVDHCLAVPRTSHLLTPILLAIPMQLLAYHIAVRKGCDVDQPRNLAKSVTVE